MVRVCVVAVSQLGELLHPRAVSLPHVYDDLVHWGGQAWRPREHAAWRATARHVASKRGHEEADRLKTPAAEEPLRTGQGGSAVYETQSQGGPKAGNTSVEVATKAAKKGRGKVALKHLVDQARQRLRTPGRLRVGEGAGKQVEGKEGEGDDDEEEEEEGGDGDGSEEDDDEGEGGED